MSIMGGEIAPGVGGDILEGVVQGGRMGARGYFVIGALAVAFSGVALASDRPNLIVIMVDDMGYAGVSCFGNPYFETPEIDRLAREGMRLTDFHSSGTVCSPTRAGLLTGRYQQRAGIEAVIHPVGDHPEHRKGLKREESTFAELLKEAGYVTGLVGKWHQGYPHNSDEYHPQEHGFDEFIGYHSGNIDFVSHVGDHVKHDWWHGREETVEEGYSTHLINRYAMAFIEEHREEPFCLYVAHEAIHNPVQVPGDPIRRSEEEGWVRWKAPSEEARIEKYKGMTLPIDEGVGEIRALLEELGLAENTFVFFFSDNGPSRDFPSGSPALRAGKGSVYEGGHRVPAIGWWPGRISAGSESAVPGISIDVMPTLLSLAGVAAPEERRLDGVDLSPVLFGEGGWAERPLFWASLSNGGARSEAMREGPWKLVVMHPKARAGTFENEKVELYRLDEDGGEERDMAGEEPERTAAMLGALKAWYGELEETATVQEGGWLAEE
jgi:arylsulfatase A